MMRICLITCLLLGFLLSLSGCVMPEMTLPAATKEPPPAQATPPVAAEETAEEAAAEAIQADGELGDILLAELKASPAAREVLRSGRKMALEEETLIKGGCWHWMTELFRRTGYTHNYHMVFKSKYAGPYARQEQIQPGDWLYYVNHSYKRIEHSGLFVHWVDYPKKIGMILSYAGERRKEPARYRPYDLRHVYFIKRPGSATAVAAAKP
ncbi:MAG: hypothetical protein HQL47_05900 [Gammaproteobacteria bacterium]|nr:hypothetical protein [Gammaproteobacteria bacterium]